jgi:hypothetical protein
MQNTMQIELNQLYFDYISRIFSDKDLFDLIEQYEVSSPILLNVEAQSGNYLTCDFKLLYVGKETHYWFNQSERNQLGLEKIEVKEKYQQNLIDLYCKFNIGKEYRWPIFTFLDLLISELQKSRKSVGYLWTNILRHDYFGDGKVPPEVEGKITFDNNYIFQRELEILNPSAVVFVTGPQYDYILKKTFANLKFRQISKYPINEFAILESDSLTCKAVRVYHPDAHKYKGSKYRLDLKNAIAEYFDQ